jgi:hypothetical protein
MAGLGMDTYSTLSWNDPSQSSPGGYFGSAGASMTINQPGTAANTLAAATPDGATPTGQTVVNAFSNTNGGAQPGVLPLDPNQTANNLSFVVPPAASLQCQVVSWINSSPALFVGGIFALVFLMNHHGKGK